MLLTGWIFEEDTAALSEGDSRFSLVGVGWEACNSTALTSSCLPSAIPVISYQNGLDSGMEAALCLASW